MARSTVRLRRESGLKQGAVEKFSGTVACEHTSSTISTMSSRREPHDQHARLRISKSGDWPAPVIAIAVSAALHGRDVVTVFPEPRAAVAIDDFLLQRDQVLHLSMLQNLSIYKWEVRADTETAEWSENRLTQRGRKEQNRVVQLLRLDWL